MENQTRLHVTGEDETITRREWRDLERRVDVIESNHKFVLGAAWAVGALTGMLGLLTAMYAALK